MNHFDRDDNFRGASERITPSAHLMAHFLELVLKHNLLCKGWKPVDLKKKYGHNLWNLWMHADSSSFRSKALDLAKVKWDRACQPGLVKETTPDSDGGQQLEVYLSALSKLHGSNFALRYPAAVSHSVPRLYLLRDTFAEILGELLLERKKQSL